MRHISILSTLLLSSVVMFCPAPGVAQTTDPDPARFTEAISRFEIWDAQNAAPTNGILFVGSSSIVRWATADRFPSMPVINRGFGGSHISDVNYFLEQTVLKYAPELIVFYAGNNDIHAGKAPAEVLEDYQEFVDRVMERSPETQILFISIHPSPARWPDWPMVREANSLIRTYADEHAALHYIDIADPMLGSDGEPIPTLFVDDGLHLSEAGYDVWTPIVARALTEARVGL